MKPHLLAGSVVRGLGTVVMPFKPLQKVYKLNQTHECGGSKICFSERGALGTFGRGTVAPAARDLGAAHFARPVAAPRSPAAMAQQFGSSTWANEPPSEEEQSPQGGNRLEEIGRN